MRFIHRATDFTAPHLLLLLVTLLGGGCATHDRAADSSLNIDSAPVDLRALPIFDGPTGLRTSWDSLVAACARADVVLIGEMHGHPVGLPVAAKLYEQVAARMPNTAALGLEFITRNHQAALDDYLAGLTDEDTFRAAAHRTDSNYPRDHSAMVESARKRNQPVLATNAPRQYVRLARTAGFDRLRELTDEQRRLFVIPETLTEGAYRDTFYELMSGMSAQHSPGDSAPEQTPEQIAEAKRRADEMTRSFYRAQNVWDATMAAAIADTVSAGRAPVLQVVGQFHVDSDGGLTQRLRSLLPDAEIIVVSMSDETGEDRPEQDADRADWIIHVGQAE